MVDGGRCRQAWSGKMSQRRVFVTFGVFIPQQNLRVSTGQMEEVVVFGVNAASSSQTSP